MAAVSNSDMSIRACPTCGQQYRAADERNERCPNDGSTTILVQVERLINQIVCDRYKIASLIGVGAWSEVYKAIETSTGTPYAVKILHTHLSVDPLNVSRFSREADVLLQLKHRCFATIYQRGLVEGVRPCLVMEFLAGLSLDNYLSSVGRLTLSQALELFEPVCDALANAHNKGLLHRDLKPSNIFLLEKDGIVIPKILDFGLAKMFQAGSGGAMASLTQSGEILGTPSYMSPEQCQGNILDQRSDLYSLGCVLYEVLTNQKAVPGKTAFEAMSNQIGRIPDPMTKVCPEALIPEEVEALIFQLLSKDPADRFEDAKEFASAFRSAVEHAGKGKSKTAQAFIDVAAADATLSRRPANESPAASGSYKKQSSTAPDVNASASFTTSMAPASVSGRYTASASSSTSGRLKLTANAAQSMQVDKSPGFWQQINNPLTLAILAIGLLVAGGCIWLMSGMVDSMYKAPPTVKEADTMSDLRHVAGRSAVSETATNDFNLAYLIRSQPQITSLDLSKKRYSVQGLKHLADAKSLVELHALDCTDVGDSTLALLKDSNIKHLDLSGTSITGAGLHYLQSMKSLRSLNVSNTAIRDADCETIAALPLWQLDLCTNKITSNGLKYLSKCKTLNELFLDRTILREGIGGLNSLPLTQLTVRHTYVSDKDLASVNLPKLQRLNVDDTQITDAGLMKMLEMKELISVMARECPNITAEGVKKVQAAAAAKGRHLEIVTVGLGQKKGLERLQRAQDAIDVLN